MSNKESVPPCRTGVTEEDLAREAERAVLYGAILLAQRPVSHTRIKQEIAAAVEALLPAVRAFLQGGDEEAAAYALSYARACGAEAFLRSKRGQPAT